MPISPRPLVAAVGALLLGACAPGLRPIAEPLPARDARPTPSVRAGESQRAARALGLPTDPGERSEMLEGEAADAGPQWDLDVRSFESHDQVSRYVTAFTRAGARERFGDRLARGSAYEPMIRGTLRAQGLPEDLYFLALIESGFDVHAYSRSAAVGLWQFMEPTAKGYGLRVDGWVDERRDPVAATTAAARFLRALRDKFGSDFLAAAAYNGGPGRIERSLAQQAEALAGVTGDEAFFALGETGVLPTETRNYVPQLIAAALVGKEPARHGIVYEARAPYGYDSVAVPGASSLPAVARAADVPLDSVLQLNPHLLRGATPPEAARWYVRLPQGAGTSPDGFAEAWRALPEAEREAFVVAKVRKGGESIADAARRLETTPRQLARFNPDARARGGRLVAGQTLRVPRAEVARIALDVPDAAIDRLIAAATPPRTHTVSAGETLDGIARRHDVTVKQIQRWNGMGKKTLIRPGQELVVAEGGSTDAKGAVGARKAAKGKGKRSAKRAR